MRLARCFAAVHLLGYCSSTARKGPGQESPPGPAVFGQVYGAGYSSPLTGRSWTFTNSRT